MVLKENTIRNIASGKFPPWVEPADGWLLVGCILSGTFDGAFYLDYNSGALGGVANHSEKMWQYLAVFILMPMRVVSAWAFLQMRTWGLHFMKVSAWLYLFLWVGYTMAMSPDFPVRMANSELVDVQPVLPLTGIRAALSVHRRQESMVPIVTRMWR